MKSNTIYSTKLPGIGPFRFAANLVEASAPIQTEGADGDWVTTQYQTADARHDQRSALKLALLACGREFFAEPGDERDSHAIVGELCADVDISAEED